MKKKGSQENNNKLIIDARSIPDPQKKFFFFQAFDSLSDNEELILVNSHDSSPLKKLFSMERPGMFRWENILEGPPLWEISIRKKSLENFTVKDLIHVNPGAIYVLSRYGFDFYTNSEETIKNLFAHKRESYKEIINESLAYQSPLFESIRPQTWSSGFIIQYITENHHQYIYQKVPDLHQLIYHLHDNFNTEYPQLQQLSESFTQFTDELYEHFGDEEKVVFPLIEKLAAKKTVSEEDKQMIRNHINWIMEDHFLAGDNLKSIRQACNNYRVKKEDIPGIRLLYEELSGLEKDFLLHILFENHFLVKALEREVLK